MPIFFIASTLGFLFSFFPCFYRRMVENKFNKWDNHLSQILVPCSVGDFCSRIVTRDITRQDFFLLLLSTDQDGLQGS